MKKLNIGNKERPIKLGLNQSILYCELRGVTITEMNEDFQKIASGTGTGAEVRDLVYSALKDGCRAAKIESDFDNMDVGDWLEVLDAKELTKFFESMAGAMPKGEADSSDKKKV